MKKAHYQIHHSNKGFYFTLVAANGKTVGGSMNEYYDTKSGCKQGIIDHHCTSRYTNKSLNAEDIKGLKRLHDMPAMKKTLRIVDKTK